MEGIFQHFLGDPGRVTPVGDPAPGLVQVKRRRSMPVDDGPSRRCDGPGVRVRRALLIIVIINFLPAPAAGVRPGRFAPTTRTAMTAQDNVSPPVTLDTLDLNRPMLVADVRVPAELPEWRLWLEEIGFIPGEPVCVLARALPGGDPLVVRVGSSTFALRRAEAACVLVEAAA
jgi:ferrous iron transport protein A